MHACDFYVLVFSVLTIFHDQTEFDKFILDILCSDLQPFMHMCVIQKWLKGVLDNIANIW